MEDGGDESYGQIAVHEGEDASAMKITRSEFCGRSGDQYTASVQQILVEFRRQASALMSAQIQLHNRQTINQEQLTVQDSCTKALVPLESSAKERGLAVANEVHLQLEESARNKFNVEKASALTSLEKELIERLSKTEKYIQETVSTALTTSRRETKDAKEGAMQLVQAFQEKTEHTLQKRIESAVASQTECAMATAINQLVALFQEQTKNAFDEVHALAIEEAESAAVDCVDRRAKEIEQKVLENFRSEPDDFRSQQTAGLPTGSSLTDEASATIFEMMKEFEPRFDKKIKVVRLQRVEKAEAAVSACVQRHSQEAEKKMQMFLTATLSELALESRQ